MNVGIIGAGVMGAGIAQVCAMAGHRVMLYDRVDEALHNALASIKRNLDKGIERGKLDQAGKEICLKNIELVNDIHSLKADLLLEAIVEKLEVKVELFKQLATINGPESILATNTSSIPITQISAQISHPERVVGIHFFNPAHIMKLVEIVRGAHTSEETSQKAFEFVKSIGKQPIKAADAPGFIVNRVARHFYVESLKALEENVASHQDIDELLVASGFKMGPFTLMDLIGVETNYSVTNSMFELFNQDSKFRPSRIQKQKVDAGHHGRKTGRGFYHYE
jgi:3-hydroxybutyryl-CoA dehydrogenase